VSETADAAALRDWIARHLDPLEDRDPVDGIPMLEGVPDGDHAPASVLIGLVERPAGYTVLLTRRVDTMRSHAGQVALPGGRRDPGETAWQTALREAEEEIGLASRYVDLAGLLTPMFTHSGYLVTPVVGFIKEGFQLRPNPHEVADIFETPFGFLMDPANHKKVEREFDGRMSFYYAITHEDRRIWGLTASILRSLYDRLYGAALA